jgi:hypothetical protein
MDTMRDILDRLSDDDKQLLNYAFEHGLAQFVRLPDNRFIGVNIDHLTYLEPQITVGVWRTGIDRSAGK